MVYPSNKGSRPLVYITPRSFNVGTKSQPVWEKRAVLVVSPYGELEMRMRSGQIKHADKPVVVYASDKFRVGTNESGKLIVKEYEANIPRPENDKIIACFMRIERHDGSFEVPFLDMNEVSRLAAFSAKQNSSTGANALYTSNNGQIDTGFLMAKTIKHAFKTYSKVRTGQFTEMETQIEEIPTVIDYGIHLQDAAVINEDRTESFMDNIPTATVEDTVIHEDEKDTF